MVTSEDPGLPVPRGHTGRPEEAVRSQDIAAYLAALVRRRDAALRLPPLAGGRRDPWQRHPREPWTEAPLPRRPVCWECAHNWAGRGNDPDALRVCPCGEMPPKAWRAAG